MYRYEGDNYVGGNPWVISSLWMSLYFLKLGNKQKAREYFNWSIDTKCQHGYLAEQIDKETNNPAWVIGLGWSHAMFILVLKELYDLGEV